MNLPAITDAEKVLIDKLQDTYAAYWKLVFELRDTGTNHVDIVKHLAWKSPSTWDFIALLSLDDRKSLFAYMLDTATDINQPCRKLAFEEIYRLPRAWVLENIEEEMQALIETYQDEAYKCILDLYEHMDFDKAIEWARRAYQHENDDIKELGQDWLKDNLESD